MPPEAPQPAGAGNGTSPQPGPMPAAPSTPQAPPPKPSSGGTGRILPSSKDTATTRIIPQIATAGPKKTVLVCDDVTQIRKILCFNLKMANYETLEAEDGAEAIKISETQKVDLILLDVMTPKVDGFTACGKIKANPNTKDVPIIMLTACSQKEDVIRALSNGACDYIVKPFKKETVLQKIERAIAAATAPPGADALSAPTAATAPAQAPPAAAAPPPSAAPARS